MCGHQDHPLPPISRQNVARSGCKGLTAAVVAPSPQKPLRADGRMENVFVSGLTFSVRPGKMYIEGRNRQRLSPKAS